MLLQKLELVNGVLFTGGWAKRGLYFEVVREIFKVLNMNCFFNYMWVVLCLPLTHLMMIMEHKLVFFFPLFYLLVCVLET